MRKLTTFCLAPALVVGLVWTAVAQDAATKPAAKVNKNILQPEMTVESGSYDAPMAKVGQKPAQPWSSTTVGAAVNGKPNPGAKELTAVGEVVDFSCYLQIGKHGEKHRSCAQKCLTNGAPIGLLTKDGTLYMLMEEEHDPRRDGLTNFRQTAIEHAGHIIEVTGTSWALPSGYKALYVQGFLKK